MPKLGTVFCCDSDLNLHYIYHLKDILAITHTCSNMTEEEWGKMKAPASSMDPQWHRVKFVFMWHYIHQCTCSFLFDWYKNKDYLQHPTLTCIFTTSGFQTLFRLYSKHISIIYMRHTRPRLVKVCIVTNILLSEPDQFLWWYQPHQEIMTDVRHQTSVLFLRPCLTYLWCYPVSHWWWWWWSNKQTNKGDELLETLNSCKSACASKCLHVSVCFWKCLHVSAGVKLYSVRQ